MKKNEIKKLSRILVFGGHPDDVEIGMGATIGKLCKVGYDVIPIIAVVPNSNDISVEKRKKEAIKSSKILGCRTPLFMDIDQNEFVLNRKLVQKLDYYVTKFEPKYVFTNWLGDSHQDHVILTRSVIAASRKVDNIFMYENTLPGGLTEKSFRPQLFINVDSTIDIKNKSLNCFKTQKKLYGSDWIEAIISRCKYRGFQINSKYAEAFEIIKMVSRNVGIFDF